MAKRKRRKIKKNIFGSFILFFFLVATFVNACNDFYEHNQPVNTPNVVEQDMRYRNTYNFENFKLVDNRLYYESDEYTSETGIDVSVHQKEIDFNKVKNDGISFVYIRVGYRGYSTGEIHEDAYFRENIKNAINAGLKVGVYFFSQATNAKEAQEEAEFVLYCIKDYKIALPIAYDMEYVTQEDRIKNLTNEQLTECAKSFADTIRSAGYDSTIYESSSWLIHSIDMTVLQDYNSFWVASYHTGKMPYNYVFDIWQYTPNGRVEGIETDVDMNIMIKKK